MDPNAGPSHPTLRPAISRLAALTELYEVARDAAGR
jgi:hypothetical protein